ncbi:MAG: alpha/beta fold hydrolase [Betaproteobacteria bacterium]|nr:alpha/beta fold hydrolase [Betaproteobacteria bacterium]
MNAALPESTVRILVDEDAFPAPPEDLLVALLTGTLSHPEDFHREGFVQAARDRGVRADIALVGTPAARVADGTVADVLEESLWAPARARGRRRLWLAGISLGGLAAMAYALRHPQAVAGLVLLAPYPGSRDWLRRMDAEGGAPGLAGAPARARRRRARCVDVARECRSRRRAADLSPLRRVRPIRRRPGAHRPRASARACRPRGGRARLAHLAPGLGSLPRRTMPAQLGGVRDGAGLAPAMP